MSCNTEFFYRISLLAVSVSCVVFTLGLVGYVYQHRKIKVFKVASPIFLCITLLGCSIMYLEVRLTLSLFSVDKKTQLDVTFCILYFSSNCCSTCFGQLCAHHQELTTA